MKKLLYIVIFILSLLVALGIFVNSNYFFDNYIAKNIKKYGFNYVKAKGEIFKGFLIEGLSYKNKELSSNVELKIDSLKLITGIISIKKLHLIGVKKDVLEEVVNDFSSKSSNSNTKSNIGINFEFKNTLLTMKPFKIDKIEVKKAVLSIDKISYINNKFNIGNLEYQSKSNLGDVDFYGEFHKKILKISKISIFNLNLNKFISILNEYKKQESNGTISNSEMFNSPFTPKLVLVKNAKLKLMPSKYNDLSIKNLDINIKDAKFDVKNILIKKANLNVKYNGKEAFLAMEAFYNDGNLTINNLNSVIKKPNKIENILKNIIPKNKKSDTKNSNQVIVINQINLNNFFIKIRSYFYKKEKLRYFELQGKKLAFNLNSKILNYKKIKLKLTSNILNISLDTKLKKDLLVKYLYIKSNNVNRVISILPRMTSNNDSNISYIKLPNKFIVDRLNIDLNKATFGLFKLDSGSIKGSNIVGAVKKLDIISGFLDVNATSPWGKANLIGNIKNNNFYAKGYYKVEDNLFKQFSIPINAKNLDRLAIKGRFGFNSLDINTTLRGNDILKNIKGFDILNSKNHLVYNYDSRLIWDINAKANIPYMGISKINNRLIYDDKLNYYGEIKPKNTLFNNNFLNKLLSNYNINYQGNEKHLEANIESKYINAKFTSNYNRAKIDIKNNQNIDLSNILELPNRFKSSKISNLNITTNINFDRLFPLKGLLNLKSNILNIKGDWLFNNNFNSNLIIDIPKSSIIVKNYEKLNYSAIKKFNSKISFDKNNLIVDLRNNYLSSKIKYNLNQKLINTTLKLSSTIVDVRGNINNLNSNIKINSIKQFINNVNKVYKISSNKKIDGDLSLNLNIKNLKKLSFKIKSHSIKLDENSKINNFKSNGNLVNNILTINQYSLDYSKYNIYSTIPSKIIIDNNLIVLDKFYVNNSLTIQGNYNINRSLGNFELNSNNFKLSSQEADIKLYVKLNVKINKERKSIKGLIDILEGKLKKSITRKNIADNKDIIILQRKKKRENTSFAKYVKLDLKIKSKKGLIYSQSDSYFKLIPNIKIKKDYNHLSYFLGNIKVTKNSYYILNGKKLKIVKGNISFKGSSTSPNLNIELKYKGENYTIYVDISGTPTNPILYFRSNPPLSKDEILAYLLFDDTSAVGTHSQESMLNMIGGTIAKSLLSSIGIKIDHITVKENGFSIGKKIGKNVIIYYNQDGEKASVKTRIDITKSIHTEIEIGKDKQSADIIFSNEY